MKLDATFNAQKAADRNVPFALSTVLLTAIGSLLVSCNLTTGDHKGAHRSDMLPPGWHSFRSEGGGFSVISPVVLKEIAGDSKAYPQVGAIDYHHFAGQQGNVAYDISYFDYQKELANQRDQEGFLDDFRDGMGKLALASKISKISLLGIDRGSVRDYPGRDIVAMAKVKAGNAGDESDVTIHSRTYLVRNRVYLICVLGIAGELNPDEIMKFLDSFMLINNQRTERSVAERR